MIKSALILDDSPSARLDLKTKVDIIASPGELYEASNYEEAVQVMLQHSIDVVFVDLSMPKKNGMDFIVDFIHTQESLKDTPVIVTTSVDKNSVLRKALKGQVISLLTKPVNMDLLENAIVKISYKQTAQN